MKPYIGAYYHTLLAFGKTIRPDFIFLNASRNDKGLCVMHDKWAETSIHALDHGLITLHEIEDLHTAVGLECYRNRKLSPSRFDKLIRMQSSTYLIPSLTFCYRLKMICKMFVNIVSIALPCDNLTPPLDIFTDTTISLSSWLRQRPEQCIVPPGIR